MASRSIFRSVLSCVPLLPYEGLSGHLHGTAPLNLIIACSISSSSMLPCENRHKAPLMSFPPQPRSHARPACTVSTASSVRSFSAEDRAGDIPHSGKDPLPTGTTPRPATAGLVGDAFQVRIIMKLNIFCPSDDHVTLTLRSLILLEQKA